MERADRQAAAVAPLRVVVCPDKFRGSVTAVEAADAVLDLLGVDRLMRRSALAVTGEGSLDVTSVAGKAPIERSLADAPRLPQAVGEQIALRWHGHTTTAGTSAPKTS